MSTLATGGVGLADRDVKRHNDTEVDGVNADRLDQGQNDGHDQNDCGSAVQEEAQHKQDEI